MLDVVTAATRISPLGGEPPSGARVSLVVQDFEKQRRASKGSKRVQCDSNIIIRLPHSMNPISTSFLLNLSVLPTSRTCRSYRSSQD